MPRRWATKPARRQNWEKKGGVWQPVLREEHIVREIITRLWFAKIKVFRINQPVAGKTPQNVAGIPDLMGWIPFKVWDERVGGGVLPLPTGVPLFIEVKRPGGARRPAQIQFIDEAAKDGCIAFFADSWDEVVKQLDKFGFTIEGGSNVRASSR